MTPSVTTLAERCWAGAQNVLQRSTSWAQLASWCVCFSPRTEVCWARQDVVHCPNQEGYAVRLALPELRPGDLAVHGMLPPGPGPLLPHSSCSACPSFLHSSSDLFLYSAAFLLPLHLFMSRRCWEHPQACSASGHHSHKLFMPQSSLCIQHSGLGAPLPPCLHQHSCLGHLWVVGVSIHQHLTCPSHFKLLFQGFQRQPEHCGVSIEGDVAETPGQP